MAEQVQQLLSLFHLGNPSHAADLAGNISCFSSSPNLSDSWIVDSGASNHITYSTLLCHLFLLPLILTQSSLLTSTGPFILSDNLSSTNVFHVLSF